MSLAESLTRTPEAWFVKMDANGDDRLTYVEYAAGNRALVQNNRCRAVFDAIERNGDGNEFLASRPAEASDKLQHLKLVPAVFAGQSRVQRRE